MVVRERKVFTYGKGRNKGKRKENAKKSMVDFGEFNRALKRYVSKGLSWPIERSTIEYVEEQLSFPLRKKIKEKLKSKKEINVVDLGCGRGVAIDGIAKIKGVNAYGFSKNAYKEWVDNNRVKFIHSDDRFFSKYFKKNSVDVIYSHLGFIYFGGLTRSIGENYIEILKPILPSLKKGGIFVADITPERGRNRNKQQIEIEDSVFEVQTQPRYYTRNGSKVLFKDVIVARRIK
jgi:SAM-dependent methyltransferase